MTLLIAWLLLDQIDASNTAYFFTVLLWIVHVLYHGSD